MTEKVTTRVPEGGHTVIVLNSDEGQHPAEEHLPDVWCVIPHFGSDDVLDRCCESLLAVDYPEDRFSEQRIVIVNNNPPNDNLLFTTSINRGILHVQRERRRLGQDSRCIIWVLNNDTIVQADCIREAARCFAEEGWETTGIVGPRNLSLDNPDRIVWGGSLRPFPFGQHKVGSVANGDLDSRTEEEWVTFSAAFLNADMVDALGILDKNLVHVASDSDYCLRARYQGWRIFHEPLSVIQHAVGTSNRHAPDWLNKQMNRDRQHFVAKWLLPNKLYATLTRYPARVENGRLLYPE